MVKKYILKLMLCVAFFALMIFVVSCGGESEKGLSVGGETINETTKGIIVGAEDLHVPKNTTDLDEITKNVIFVKNQRTESVTVVFDFEQLKNEGTYDLIYRSNDGEVETTVKVYVYGIPSMIDNSNSQSIELSYEEVYNGINKNILAKDSFGRNLDVRIQDDDGLFNSDGTHKYGEFEIRFVATDMAGQSVNLNKIFIVGEPELFDINNGNFDFADDVYKIDLSGYTDNFLNLAVNGYVLGSDEFTIQGSFAFINSEVFYAYDSGESVKCTLVTTKGYGCGDIKITDDGKVAYDDTLIRSFFSKRIAIFREYKFPGLILTNKKQEVNPEYYVIDNSTGQSVKLTGHTLNLDNLTDYSFKIYLREGQELIYSINAICDLGYKDNMSITNKDTLNGVVTEGFNFKSYAVLKGGDKIVDSKNFMTLNQFNLNVLELDGTITYRLEIKADRENKEYSQIVRINVISAGIGSILTSTEEIGTNIITNITELKFTEEDVGGRNNVFRWATENENAFQITAGIHFGEHLFNKLNAGDYLIFDIYLEKPLSLILYEKGVPTYLYSKEYADGRGGVYSSFEVFDENGEKVSYDLNNEEGTGKWLTFKIKLKYGIGAREDGSTEWNGICPIQSGGSLYENNVYVSNIKYYNLPEEEDNYTEDFWADIGQLY